MRPPALPSVPPFPYRNAKDTDVSLTFLEAYKRLWRAEEGKKSAQSPPPLKQRQQ